MSEMGEAGMKLLKELKDPLAPFNEDLVRQVLFFCDNLSQVWIEMRSDQGIKLKQFSQ